MNLLGKLRPNGCVNTALGLTFNRNGDATMAKASNNDSVEIWKPIPGWEGLYEASSFGRIRSLDRIIRTSGCPLRRKKGVVLRPGLTSWGYQIVALKRTGEKAVSSAVHRLVCSAFHGPPAPKMDAAHADGTRVNNRPENLRWATRTENFADKYIHGTMICGEAHYKAKLTPDKVREIRSRYAGGESQKSLGKAFGIDTSNISYVVRRKTWAHI